MSKQAANQSLPAKRERRDRKTPPGLIPPYAVIVYDDDEHTYEYVIDVLQRVCRHNTTLAYMLTRQIDKGGRAIVWTGSKEVAELKRDQIRGFGPDFYAEAPIRFSLGVSIEPLPQS